MISIQSESVLANMQIQNAVLPISNEQNLLMEYEDLGLQIQDAQKSFTFAVKTTIQHACEIGRIAFEAKECIRNLPTKAEKAKADRISIRKLDYKKPTFEQWIEAYTGLGKDTVYSMLKLYENLRDTPDYEIPEDMGWRECLGFFSTKQKLLKSEETEEGDGDNDGDSGHKKFEFERKAFNKLYENMDEALAQFLDTSENQELKEIVARWKNFLTNDISTLNLPQD